MAVQLASISSTSARDELYRRFRDRIVPDPALNRQLVSYRDSLIEIAVEIKGGIDTAGVHERYGAIGNSFEKPKKVNPKCITILIIQAVSLTPIAKEAFDSNRGIDLWFTLEDILTDAKEREEFLTRLGI